MSHPLIIDRPDLQNFYARSGWGALTFIFWAIYIYLWMPLITLFAWWIGIKLFHTHFIELHGGAGLLDKLGLYGLVILLLSTALIMWAYIEQLRFKGKRRRQVGNAVTIEQVAHKYQINEQKLARIRHKKVLEVHFSNQGEISKIVEI